MRLIRTYCTCLSDVWKMKRKGDYVNKPKARNETCGCRRCVRNVFTTAQEKMTEAEKYPL